MSPASNSRIAAAPWAAGAPGGWTTASSQYMAAMASARDIGDLLPIVDSKPIFYG